MEWILEVFGIFLLKFAVFPVLLGLKNNSAFIGGGLEGGLNPDNPLNALLDIILNYIIWGAGYRPTNDTG